VVAEIQAIGGATGVALAPYGMLTLVAWRGDETGAAPLIEASMADAVARGEDSGVMVANWARALLCNGLGRFPEALSSARAATGYPNETPQVYWALSELIEAAVRSGRPDLAAGTRDRLAISTRAAGTDWALGILARAEALLAAGPAAAALYRQAIDHLGRTRIRMELARAHLLYGEWLRQDDQHAEARAQLRIAYDMFTAADARGFAERARRELAGLGEAVAERASRASDGLTVQEGHIARLAGEGLTNAEIGAKLFLSPHTVEWHLRKVFAKLGIRSRKQLRPAVQHIRPASPGPPPPGRPSGTATTG
jgi:DNA-binding CsgD family transcriptional regulator